MNQHIIAGIGNIYSDEILFQAEINPNTNINKLNEKSLKKLFEKMKNVLRTAIDRKANFEDFPNNYLIPHRSKGGKCPKGDNDLQIIKISGRTSYFCPKHQKELQ
jgi:formamidopyrimidine-DNA glycosylase